VVTRRYVARYVYTEVVRGEPRRFEHETIVEAPNLAAAHGYALLHFEHLARTSGVGWTRTLERCDVVPAKQGAVAKGGRRAEPDADAGT
jgi:hypothetical protein